MDAPEQEHQAALPSQLEACQRELAESKKSLAELQAELTAAKARAEALARERDRVTKDLQTVNIAAAAALRLLEPPHAVLVLREWDPTMRFRDVQCDDELEFKTFMGLVTAWIPTPPSRGSGKDNIEFLLVKRAGGPLPSVPPSAEEIEFALNRSEPITNLHPESGFKPGAYFYAREKRPSLLCL